jgi:hypothetical protein
VKNSLMMPSTDSLGPNCRPAAATTEPLPTGSGTPGLCGLPPDICHGRLQLIYSVQDNNPQKSVKSFGVRFFQY